uniref:Uncharacterized protein n=1 Tax=Arundo donax TaxID=35708 RepID=A0A0A8YUV1_ARUDO
MELGISLQGYGQHANTDMWGHAHSLPTRPKNKIPNTKTTD